MNVSPDMHGVRVSLSVDEAVAVARFLKARREGGLMISTDTTVVNSLEAKVTEAAKKCVEWIEPHISASKVAELHRDFIQAMCPTTKLTLRQRMLASFEEQPVLAG